MSFFMKRIYYLGMALVIASLAVTGCGQKKAASVNGTPIYMADLDKRIDVIEENVGRSLTKDEEKQLDVKRQTVLNELIRHELVRQGAKSMKIKVDKAKVDAEYAKRIKKYPGEGAFLKSLETQGLDKKDFRKGLEVEYLASQITLKFIKDMGEPNDKNLRAYYDKKKQYFMDPEKIRVRDIPIAGDDVATEAANAIKARMPMVEVAQKYSSDTQTKASGGDLGFFARGTYGVGFENAAFSIKREKGNVFMTKINEVTHIIELIDWQDPRQLSFEEAKDKVKSAYQYEEGVKAFNKWYQGFAKKAKVKKHI